ncbi:MAG TPA: ATP-binding protein, partial [bacterium]|nr:ATP-binding protein [bacterium]
ELVGEDKVQRLLGFSQLLDPSYGSQGMYVVVSIPTKAVLADTNRALVRNLIALGVVAALALIAALLGGEVFILRKVKRLVEATKRFASGDLRMRVHDPDRGELGLLAEAFNEMAEALAVRQEEIERTAEALRESNEKLRALIQASPLPILALDPQGNIMMWNQAAERVFGWSEQEVLGLPNPIIPSEMDAEYQENLDSALRGEIVAVRETRRQKRDGSLIDVNISWASMHGSQGNIVSIISLLSDITERKQADQLMESQRKALYQSEKLASIGQLAAGVAHELNNPIAFVKSNLGTLREYVNELTGIMRKCQEAMDYQKDGDKETCSRFIGEALHLAEESDLENILSDLSRIVEESREGAERVAKIVLDLKNFARADEAELKYADINQGIVSTLNIVWNELKYKATVTKELGELPEIECYPMQLNQVFMNLLVNAAQAIPEKGEIRIKTYVRDDEVVVEVSDTGIGISQEHLNRLFEPFFTTKPVGKGTGLGLSIAYGIVKKHGGTIEVESEMGKGSLFRVKLPLESKYAAAHDSLRG